MSEIATHAADRARERYGIDLTFDQVLELARRCKRGEGLLETQPSGIRRHALVFGDRVLWAVYAPPTEAKPDGVVITITPPASGAVDRSSANSVRHKLRRINGNGRHRDNFRRIN